MNQHEVVPVVEVGGEVQLFNPARTARVVAQADAVIEYATTIKDWPLLMQAVEAKIEEQAKFVAWWDRAVTPREKLGKRANHPSAVRGQVPQAKAEAQTGIKHQTVSRWNTRLKEPEKYRDLLYGVAYRKAMDEAHNHRSEGTGENEWYTPRQYVEAARGVLGAIDLDPASNDIAQEWIGAKRYYTTQDDGLKAQWHGRVWLNPPFAQPAITQFVEKLVAEVRAKRVTEAVMLTHNYTDTGWFHHAESAAAALCFTRGRIKFIDSHGDPCAPTQGQAFFYFGPRRDVFASTFVAFGFIR
jgi:phage N-6-adenine-methyltransferase